MKNVYGLRSYLGLMFRTKKTEPILIDIVKQRNIPIHSFFIFFDFKVKWFNEEMELIEEQIIKPFKRNIKPSKPFRYIYEEPILQEKEKF